MVGRPTNGGPPRPGADLAYQPPPGDRSECLYPRRRGDGVAAASAPWLLALYFAITTACHELRTPNTPRPDEDGVPGAT